MITILEKIFIKNKDDKSKYKQSLGILCSSFGIFLNILLFIGKYLAGVLTASISITADAFNNLSDAGSSIISLIGFKFAGMKPDKKHPFGHGRIEYLSGLAISVIIIVVGIELGISSIHKITNPEPIDTSIAAIIILIVSILVKLYMFIYNRRIGKRINSTSMAATSMDSISDCIATAAVLVSTIISMYFGINVDGWCGIIVSLFILYSGIMSAKDIIAALIGKAPDKEFVDKIEQIVMSYKDIEGIHDLIIHDYGLERYIISLHAEVDGNKDIYELHDIIDTIEKDLDTQLGCESTIHMDPIDLNNPLYLPLREEVSEIAKNIHEEMTIHDFRMVPGNTHTNLIFDIVVPTGLKLTNDEIKEKIQSEIQKEHKNYLIVVHFDNPYT